MAITIIVTNAGRAALVNAANTGTNAVTISQMGVTQTAFVPNAAQVALPGEVKRIASVGGIVVSDDVIHVTVSDTSNAAYAMRGLAFYLADGTLFAIYGQAGAILNKTAESMMLLALDIAFADIDAEMIEFGDTNFILPQATTEILGLVELATTAEAQTGTDNQRALTPLTGKQSAFGWILSQDGSGSGLDADLLDGQHASAFAAAGHTHGTMASQNANAVNITGGSLSGVTLAAVSGAAATPSISFSADADTGLFRPGANVIAISTGGDERLRVDTAGNVGIGASPNYRFDVHGGSVDGQILVARFRASNAAATVQQSTNFYSDATARRSIIQSYGGPADGDLSFYCGNNERMVLTAPGQLQLFRGSAAAPAFSFLESPTTGIYRSAPDALGFATAGLPRAFFLSDGHLLPAATGAYDFGSTGSRWRNLYATGLDINSPAGTPLAILNASGVANDADRALQFRIGGTLFGTVTIPSGSGGAMAFAVGNGAVTERLRIAVGGTVLPGSDASQDFGSSGLAWKSGYFSGSVNIGGNGAWHAGNDGSGSGLDADLLDGQHGAYYLPAASYTAADVRTKLLTVDGAGSAIDADLLDGQHGAYYLPAASYTAADVLAKLLGVDGSGSGLDADLLDGLQAADFVKYTDFTGANQNIGQPGRQRFPGGFMIQTGTYSVGANATATVTFGTSFNSICLGCICSGGRQDFAAQDNNPFVSSYNIGGATIYSSADAIVSGAWVAFGF